MNAALEVLAVGATTPVGLVAQTAAAAVRAGLSRFEEFPYALDDGLPVIASLHPKLDPELSCERRMEHMITNVMAELRGKLELDSGARVLVALPETRPGFADADANELVRSLGRSTELDVELAGRGHAGGIQAIARAHQQHISGASGPFVILAGDSYLDPGTLAWLDARRLLRHAKAPNGFIPGEAAAGLVLGGCRRGHASGARVCGLGLAHEGLQRDSDTGSLGAGLCEAVRAAAAGLPDGTLHTPYLDLNGERYRSEEWGFVALRSSQLWASLRYEAPSEQLGDIGAASSVMAAVLAVRSFARGYARGPRAMIMAGSLGGARAAMLLEAPT